MQDQEANTGDAKSFGQFQTTHWSVVLLAGQNTSPHSAAALEALCRAYWPSIFVFARRRGFNEADAKDLTQQFFSRLLERNDFAGLNPQKGRFRTFLLAAFTHFLSNERDRLGAQKRGGGMTLLSFDELTPDQLGRFPMSGEYPPARQFDVHWALAVIGQALSLIQAEMAEANKTDQFHWLKKFLSSDPGEGEYAVVARELGVADASVAVLVHRMRQRYRELVRSVVAQTVSSPTELEEEMRYLFEVLNQ